MENKKILFLDITVPEGTRAVIFITSFRMSISSENENNTFCDDEPYFKNSLC